MSGESLPPPPFSSITGRRQLVNVNGWLSDMLSVVIMYSQLDNVRGKFAPPPFSSITGRRQLVNVNGWLSDMLWL